MIDLIKAQKKESILKTLCRLGSDPTIYSAPLQGLSSQAYLFAKKDEVVLVYIESEDAGVYTKAQENPVDDKDPSYCTYKGSYVSPVYELGLVAEQIKNAMRRQKKPVPVVYRVLVTSHLIFNISEMSEEWKILNVSVFHRVEIPVALNMPTNSDTRLPGRIYDLANEENTFEEELKRLLDLESFDPTDPASEPTFPGISLDDEEDEQDEDDEDDFCFDDDELPDSEVTFNNGSTARVDIIKPLPQGEARKELDKMVGCTAIKKRIDELLLLNRYNKLIQKVNPEGKLHNICLHGVFVGRPGTGKTTLSKIYGSLLHEAGMLSKGHVVACGRGTFIGGVWGDEEKAVRQVIEKAQGGVLMIDEAYLFNGESKNDPGHTIIQLFMDMLADEKQRDIAVLFCGYKDEMAQLFKLNPGLPSRFPNTFEFPDFTVDELLEITRRRIKEYSYRFTQTGWAKYKEVVKTAYDNRDQKTWGNARFIANLLEHIYMRHAERCVKSQLAEKKRVYTITAADVEPLPAPASKPRIGFHTACA